MQPVLIAALLLAPAADPFCDGLREIVAAMPGGLETLAIGEDDAGRVNLGFEWGGGKCRVYRIGHGGIFYDDRQQPTPIYWCQENFYPIETPLTDARLREIGIGIAKCFNLPMYRDGSRWGQSSFNTYLVIVPGARIHVGAYEMRGNEGPFQRIYPPDTDMSKVWRPPVEGHAVVIQISRPFPD